MECVCCTYNPDNKILIQYYNPFTLPLFYCDCIVSFSNNNFSSKI